MNLWRKTFGETWEIQTFANSPFVGVGVGQTYYNAWAGNRRTRMSELQSYEVDTVVPGYYVYGVIYLGVTWLVAY